jgi:transcription elongation GreA/GreB family factor
MADEPLEKRTSEQLIVEAATFSALAAKAKTREAKRALEALAERFRDLAVRRAALACLHRDDPAALLLAQTIERLIKHFNPGP